MITNYTFHPRSHWGACAMINSKHPMNVKQTRKPRKPSRQDAGQTKLSNRLAVGCSRLAVGQTIHQSTFSSGSHKRVPPKITAGTYSRKISIRATVRNSPALPRFSRKDSFDTHTAGVSLFSEEEFLGRMFCPVAASCRRRKICTTKRPASECSLYKNKGAVTGWRYTTTKLRPYNRNEVFFSWQQVSVMSPMTNTEYPFWHRRPR